jgi:hypothetical protein
MIRAKDIISIIEVKTKKSVDNKISKKEIEKFKNEVEVASHVTLSFIIREVTDEFIVSFSIKLVAEGNKSPSSVISLFLNSDEFRNEFNKFIHPIEVCLGSPYIKYNAWSRSQDIDILACARFPNDPELTIENHLGSPFVEILFRSKLSLINIDPENFAFNIGDTFRQLILFITMTKLRQVSVEQVLDFKRELISKIKSTTSFIKEQPKLSPRAISFTADFLVGSQESKISNRNYAEEFFNQQTNLIGVPVKNLKKLFGEPKFLNETPINFAFIFGLAGTPEFYIRVELYSEGRSFLGEIPNNVVRVGVILYPVYAVSFMPEISIDDLTSAIGDVFIGYKKLVNQFVNKPTKKTNADW